MLLNFYPKMSMIPKQCIDGQELCGFKHKLKSGTELIHVDLRLLGVMHQRKMLMMTTMKAASFSLVRIDNGTDSVMVDMVSDHQENESVIQLIV